MEQREKNIIELRAGDGHHVAQAFSYMSHLSMLT